MGKTIQVTLVGTVKTVIKEVGEIIKYLYDFLKKGLKKAMVTTH